MLQEFDYESRPWEECVALVRERIGDKLPSLQHLKQFRVQQEWFADPQLAYGLHGIAHETRVLVLVNLLARIFPGYPFLDYERDALSASAVTHDTQRVIHDDFDLNHGDRAGAWLLDRYLYRKNQDTDYMATMPPLAIMYAAYINTHHEPEDHEDTMSELLAVFKDADALDRFRDPVGGNFDANFLRFSESRMLIPIAKELCRRSNGYITGGGDHFDSVLVAAREMGLLGGE